jgi:hypothetical protein
VIGYNEDGSLSIRALKKLSESCIKAAVDIADSITEFFFRSRIVQKVRLVHELPEIVLDGVNRHEDEHHHILSPILKKVQADLSPLFVELTHLIEHTVASLVIRHEAKESDVKLQRLAHDFLQLLPQLWRMKERALFRRGIHPGRLITIQWFGWIREWDVTDAGSNARVIKNFPNRARPA